MAKLTDRQKIFVEEYLIDLNATQAAIRAGYSPKNADKIGSELLGKTRIKEEIDKALAERSKRTGINADRVLLEYAKIAFVNPEDVVDFETGEVLKNAKTEDLAAIQSIKVKSSSGKVDTEEREVKFASKERALEMLGKHLGMFKDRVEVTGNVNNTLLESIARQLGGGASAKP